VPSRHLRRPRILSKNPMASCKSEVARLGGELERANTELTRSLERTPASWFPRTDLGRIAVWRDRLRRRPQAARSSTPKRAGLLTLDPSWLPEEGVAWPAVIDRLLAESSSKVPAAEREWLLDDPAGTRFLGITQAQVLGSEGHQGETICILRDMTQERRLGDRARGKSAAQSSARGNRHGPGSRNPQSPGQPRTICWTSGGIRRQPLRKPVNGWAIFRLDCVRAARDSQ